VAELDDPRFWQRLYSPPEDSNTGSQDASSSMEFELADLEATLSPEADADELPVNSAALSALVERLVAERLQALQASGGLPETKRSTARPPPRRAVTSPGIRTPPRRQAPTSQPSMRTIERPGRPDKSPPPPPPPRKSTKPPEPAPPLMASLTPDEPATPRPTPRVKAAPKPAPPPRPHGQARPPGPLTSGRMRAAKPPPASSGRVRAVTTGKIPVAPKPPTASGKVPAAPRAPTSSGKVPAAPRAPTSSGKVAAARSPGTPDALMWEKVPSLVGGPAALLKAENLTQDAVSVMVMVNGTTSLGGLRTLVPHLDDRAFLSIIRDGVTQGVVTLE